MANYTYEAVNPTLIENTVMQIMYIDGNPRVYTIIPANGFVLHDNTLDWTGVDFNTYEEVFYLGYTVGTVTCPVSYDFENNPREFYTVPADSVPADQIFGGVNNDHEVM